jgi:V/A-type H+-transporting ATPase subunit I
MAIIPVEKIHLVIHKSIKDAFLHELQKRGIIHITELKESTPHTSETLTRVNEALGQLSGYKKRSMLETFIKIKKPIGFEQFEKTVLSYDYGKTIKQLAEVKTKKERNEADLRTYTDQIELLLPWVPFDYDLNVLGSFKETATITCEVPSHEILDELPHILEEIPYSYEIINSTDAAIYCIFYVKKNQEHMLRSRLIENDCDTVDFKDFVGTPKNIISALRGKITALKNELEDLQEKELRLSEEISKLEIVSDLVANEHKKKEIAGSLPETSRTVHVVGWVKKRDMKQLEALVTDARLAVYETIKPDPDEHPPVALKNPKWSRPYEELIKLYSMPQPHEYDPTPFLAFFFPIFFALCITDAIYGLFMIFFSLYLLRKVAGNRNLIWIIFVGGILTIFSGAMVGGWAGDLFEYIGFQPLIQLRQSLMLFDPLKNPMIFIGIALGLGFIHMMLGIAIEVVDSIRNKEYSQAVFANLTWFIILPSILLYFVVFSSSTAGRIVLEIVLWFCIVGIIVASYPQGKAHPIDQIALGIIIWLIWYKLTELFASMFNFKYTIQIPGYVYAFIIPLLIIEIVRFKEMKKALGKVAWGLYNLYGISSYLGVVLSYVRLMALGMVTGVIAIAINKIAWMITGIPVIGGLLVILILIPSHLFNIVINALGGFIHTMRLQYIEFFGRFYTGGSKPFKPFNFETKYVEIE